MWIKIISPDKTDFWTGRLKFELDKIVGVPDSEWNPEPVCGGGIHFSESLITILGNTKHKGTGYLIEVEPIGEIIKIDNKSKSQSVKVKRFLTIPEWLDQIKADDPDGLNRLLRAACLGLDQLKADDPYGWNRRLRAACLGLEELRADDPDWLNRLLRAAKTNEWDNIFKILVND